MGEVVNLRHPITIEVGDDTAEADNLSAALVAAQTLANEAEDAVDEILISLGPGYRLVNGDLMYSDRWLN